MAEVYVFTQLDAISIIKENKTNVDYFIFDEFEVHLNKIPPNCVVKVYRGSDDFVEKFF